MAAVRSEILHLKRKLDSDLNDEQLLQIFKKLKNIPMTVDLLLETGIGKTIRSYRKNPGSVGKACKALILLWKDLVISSSDNSVSIPDTSNVQTNSNATRTLTVERENSYTVYDDGRDTEGSSSKLCSENILSNKTNPSRRESHISNSSSTSEIKKRKHSDKDHSVDIQVKKLHSSKHHDSKRDKTHNGEKFNNTHKNETHTKKSSKEKRERKETPKKSSNKHRSSPETKKVKLIQKKLLAQNDSDGFTSSMASFEDCLNISDVKKKSGSKKKVISSSQNHPPNKGKAEASGKTKSSESYAPRTSDAGSYKSEDSSEFKAKLPDLNLNLTLPATQPTYKPIRYAMPDSPPRKKKSGLNEVDTSVFMSSKHSRTQVFSGRKLHCSSEVPSLYELCIKVLQDNIDGIEYTGGVPYDRLKPILDRCTAQQLYQIEDFNPYLIEDTEELWKAHCQCEFKGKMPDECETWREFYLKMFDEREAKLKSITANISASMAKAIPVRQTKLAYVDTVAKPPRNVARQQAKYGTGGNIIQQEKMKSPHKMKGVRVPPPPPVEIAQPPKVIKKVPPLMQKTLKLMKSRFRR